MRSSGRAYLTYALLRIRSYRSWGGIKQAKKPSHRSSTPPFQSARSPVRNVIVPPVGACLLAQTALPLRGLGRKEVNSYIHYLAGAYTSAPDFLMSRVRRRMFQISIRSCEIVRGGFLRCRRKRRIDGLWKVGFVLGRDTPTYHNRAHRESNPRPSAY
jgi:hypothetical protein